MENKKLFLENLKGKLAEWKTEVESFQANADKIDREARGRYSSAIIELVGKIQRTEKKLIVIDQSSTAAWQELIRGAQNAMADIEESVKRAKKRFNF